MMDSTADSSDESSSDGGRPIEKRAKLSTAELLQQLSSHNSPMADTADTSLVAAAASPLGELAALAIDVQQSDESIGIGRLVHSLVPRANNSPASRSTRIAPSLSPLQQEIADADANQTSLATTTSPFSLENTLRHHATMGSLQQQQRNRSEMMKHRGSANSTQPAAAAAPVAPTPRSHQVDFCAVSAFLRAQGFPANLAHIRQVVHALMHANGVRFTNGSVCVLDSPKKSWVRLAVDKMTDSQLQDAVLSTATSVKEGGQGSEALVLVLQHVSSRLRDLATEVLEHLKTNSTKEQHQIGDEAEGSCYLLYTGGPDGDRQWSMQNAHANRGRLDDCAALEWFLSMALRPTVLGAVTFDALDVHAVRSGAHVVEASPTEGGGFSLSLRPFEDQPMLLDAKHDLSALRMYVALDPATLAALPEVVEARACMEGWLDSHTDFFLFSIAERLLIRTRKFAHVFEASADRGKTALLYLLLAGCGSYAERVTNDALEGRNTRTVPLAELAKSAAGVRLLLHDEVDRPDYEYLKQQSNAAAAQENTVGMRGVATAEHKAMRILTRNATTHAHKAETAPSDCRKKMVLWNDAAIHTPVPNEALHAKIKSADSTLARGFFLACLETFQRLGGKSDGEIPTALLCGDDFRNERSRPVPAVAVAVAQSEVDKGQALIVSSVQAAFHRIFRSSTAAEGGTTRGDVQAALVGQEGVPRYLAALSPEVFCTDFLVVGQDGVPKVADRGYLVTNGERKRGYHVMQVVPRSPP